MRTTRTRTAAGVAVLAVVGLVVSVAAAWPRLPSETPVREREPGPPVAVVAPPATPAPSSTDPTSHPPQKAAARHPRPIRLSADAIDLDARVRPVGVTAAGQMQLPPRPSELGWYRFGAAPSQPGSTVLAGHLDSRTYGLGPLVRLRDIAIGDRIEVWTAARSATTYSVVAIDRYDRQALPADLFARTGPEKLRVITCGGDYDARAGGYQKNLVVTARPT